MFAICAARAPSPIARSAHPDPPVLPPTRTRATRTDDLVCPTACCCCHCSDFCEFPRCLNIFNNCTCCGHQHASKCGCVVPTTCCKQTCQCCFLDCRSAFPPSKEVPCAFGLLGVLCCGQKGEQPKGEANRIDPKDLCPLASCGCEHVNLYCKFPHCCGTDCNSECFGCASGCSNKCVNCQYLLFGCPLYKCISTACCVDYRCSVPCDDDVPCAIALCGVFYAGKKIEGNEAVPMLSAATEDSDGAPQVEQMARNAQQPEPAAIDPAKVMLITIALKGACLLSTIGSYSASPRLWALSSQLSGLRVSFFKKLYVSPKL